MFIKENLDEGEMRGKQEKPFKFMNLIREILIMEEDALNIKKVWR